MKYLKFPLYVIVALIVFLSAWTTTGAAETYQKAGVITSVGYDQFTLQGRKYRFAPGATINSKDDKRQKFADLKPGDFIYFEGVYLDRVYYVNIIYYKPPSAD